MNAMSIDRRKAKSMVLAMVAALGVTVIASSAQAGNAAEGPPQRVVKYADLNLSTSAGVVELYRRIQRAANAVCGADYGRDLGEAAAVKVCTDQAIAQAVSAVDNPVLTIHYLAKTGGIKKPLEVASLR